MRKLLLAVSILLLTSSAAATTITNEEITVDLTSSEVKVDMHVEELTSSQFTYYTSYDIDNFQASSNGEEIDCEIERNFVDSRIVCDVPQKQNFDIQMNYTASGLVTEEEQKNIFQYTQNIIRPTHNYTLRVILPEGAVLMDNENISTSVIPPDGQVGSNGRRITVEWNRQPQLGQSMAFRTIYEDLSPRSRYSEVGLLAAIAVLLSIFGYVGYVRLFRESIENVYEELSEDEIEAIETIRENDGSMLQKDLVESLDYSKAKISGIVSGLVEKEVVTKEKQGRSNKLVVSKKYRV